MNLTKTLTVAALTMVGTIATAQDVGETSVGVGVSNFGLTLHGEYTLSPNLNLRGIVMGGLSIEDEYEVDDYTVDGEANFGGLAVLADYYPLANAWRISGGLFLPNSEIKGDFVGAESFTGEIVFKNDVAPLITTGFRKDFGGSWALSGDVGVIISSLEASTNDTTPAVQDEVDTINDDLNDIPVLPYVALALSFSF